MDFRVKYNEEKKWNNKVLIMRVFHMRMKMETGHWTIRNTAAFFDVSVGLVSENLKLGKFYDKVSKCSNREEALRKIR